jgi:hypothetical protein
MRSRTIQVVVLAVVMAAWFLKGPSGAPAKVKKVADASPTLSEVKVDAKFAGVNTAASEGVSGCNIEFANDATMTTQAHSIFAGNLLKLSGWAMDTKNERLPEQVLVRFTSQDGKHFFAPARAGLPRPDVRDYFHLSDKALAAGFDIHLDTRNLPADRLAIALLLQYGDQTYVCDNSRSIILGVAK